MARLMRVVAINCGSSTVKYATFDGDREVERGAVGVRDDHGDAVRGLVARLGDWPQAVGHRIVHGGRAFTSPVRVDVEVRARLASIVPLAPLHLPAELAAIDAVTAARPELSQVACFDTAFHRDMPEVARRFALPSELADAGVERYGFHGLSYEYVASTFPPERLRRAVFAHLGSGASVVAIREGRSVDTTMGFSPTGGVVMGTRSGDLDPGLILYLLDHGYDRARLGRLVDHDAGLRALSGTTPDMRALLAARASDARAMLAIDVFCYSIRKAIGGFAAVLGGVDTLVFTGGIGEHAAPVREQICDGLGYLGVALDAQRNVTHDPMIGAGKCEVRVVTTDEERVIARSTLRVHECNP
jgi:acetate kinase